MHGKLYFIFGLFFSSIMVSMPAFPVCSIGTVIECSTRFSSDKPCTRFEIINRSNNYVIIGGVSIIGNPAPRPGDDTTTTIVDTWDAVWNKNALLKLSPGNYAGRIAMKGTFSCYSYHGNGPHGPFKKVPCNTVIKLDTRITKNELGNC